jgi:hypothetical protein
MGNRKTMSYVLGSLATLIYTWIFYLTIAEAMEIGFTLKQTLKSVTGITFVSMMWYFILRDNKHDGSA